MVEPHYRRQIYPLNSFSLRSIGRPREAKWYRVVKGRKVPVGIVGVGIWANVQQNSSRESVMRHNMRAYVLINAQAGKTAEAARALAAIPGMKAAEARWGRPEIIAQVEAAEQKELSELLLAKIQKVEGIESTDTHIVTES